MKPRNMGGRQQTKTKEARLDIHPQLVGYRPAHGSGLGPYGVSPRRLRLRLRL